jgi:hypothetical protein
MGRRPTAWFAWAVSLLVLATWGRAARPGEEATAWRDPTVLSKRLAEACDAVEKATGKKFAKRPTVRVSTADEVATVLRGELALSMQAMGASEGLEEVASSLASAMLAKYEPATGVVHVLPAAVESMASYLKEPGLRAEDTLRVVLAHEATHALDFALYAWEAMRDTRATSESQKGLNAVCEGHAQLVAEEVADAWGLAPSFVAFTRAITTAPPVSSPALRQTMAAFVAEVTFAYVQGHAFLKAVRAARGLEGVEQALKDPPTGTRAVEHPALWLDPSSAAKEPDLPGVVEALAPLLADPVWSTRSDRVLQATLESQRPMIPEAHRAAFLRGYRDGRMLVGDVAGESVKAIVMALAFATPTDAVAHVAIERAVSESKDGMLEDPAMKVVSATYADRAGPGDRFPGFRVAKLIEVQGDRFRVETVLAAIDATVVQVLASNLPSLDRAAQDEAVDRAALFLKDPAAAKALPPLAPKKFRKKAATLVVLVTDGAGKPVPRARAGFVVGAGGAASRSWTTGVEAGRATLRKIAGDGAVEVWGAAAQDGTPLPLAPARVEGVAAESGEVTVRLEAGTTIEGRVRAADGTPLSGVEVLAIPAPASKGPERPPHASVNSAPDGTFRLVGVGKQAYLVEVVVPGGKAERVRTTGGATGVELTVHPAPK